MNIQEIASSPPRAIRNSRAHTAIQRGSVPKTSFDAVLQSGRHTVRAGDTLSEIVRDSLKASGQEVTRESVYRGVAMVAKANHIDNPNLIFVNQKIDLAALSTPPAPRVPAVVPAKRQTVAALVNVETRQAPARPVARPIRYGPFFSGPRPVSPWKNILEGRARLTSEFGMRDDPFTGNRHHHDGIDLGVRPGTGIVPFQGGTVIYSGWKGGYGKTVIVRHDNGLETQYSHNARNLVSVGQRVTPNTTLGLTGSTGRSTGPHLHFEMRRGDRSINPIPFLARRT